MQLALLVLCCCPDEEELLLQQVAAWLVGATGHFAQDAAPQNREPALLVSAYF